MTGNHAHLSDEQEDGYEGGMVGSKKPTRYLDSDINKDYAYDDYDEDYASY